MQPARAQLDVEPGEHRGGAVALAQPACLDHHPCRGRGVRHRNGVRHPFGTFADRGHEHAARIEAGRRLRADPGAQEQLLGEAQPAASPHDDRVAVAGLPGPFLRDPAVADAHDPVGDPGGLRVVADDDGRAAVLAHQLGEHVVDLVCGRGVELAGRLVGEEHRRAVRQGGAQRNSLLLSAGELARAARAFVGEPDPLEQRVGAAQALGASLAAQAELDRHQIARAELRGERTGIVLVGVAEKRGAVAGEPPGGQLAEILSVHPHEAGRRPLEPGEQAQQRRLARPARAENGQHLALGDAQRKALQRRSVPLRGRMDAEHILQLDRGVAGHHAAASAARSGARPRRPVAAPTSSTARAMYRSAASARAAGRARAATVARARRRSQSPRRARSRARRESPRARARPRSRTRRRAARGAAGAP